MTLYPTDLTDSQWKRLVRYLPISVGPRTATEMGCPDHHQCHCVRGVYRLPVAHAAP
jgi:hypothetical protein